MTVKTTSFSDVVCGMEVEADDISLDYQGRHYVFCSNQCLERFRSNPHLYIGFPGVEAPRHAGVEVLKKRTLKLSEALPLEIQDQFIVCIEAMMGIHEIEIQGNRINIVYDLLQVTESQIEQTISEAGIVLGADLMEKVRRAFVHYLEESELDSLEARPKSGGGHCH